LESIRSQRSGDARIGKDLLVELVAWLAPDGAEIDENRAPLSRRFTDHGGEARRRSIGGR
jgi:hypothetical protein